MTHSTYQNLPDAATVAHQLGAATVAQNDYRLADCGCSGQQINRRPGTNPALSISDGPDGLRAYCHKCQQPALDAVCAALGIEPTRRRSRTVNPYSESEGWRTVAVYLHGSTGNPRRVYRRDTPEGKEVRNQRGGSLAGYLPLSWTPKEPAPDIPQVWVDGEKTAQAVMIAGAVAISTIGGHANAVNAAWAQAADGARMLVWPDNTPQEMSAADALGRHLAGLGFTVGVLPPVGKQGTGDDAADLPDGAAILAHLRSEPTRWIEPNHMALPDPAAGDVLTGATFRNDTYGFQSAIAALGFEIRDNVRANRIEWRRTEWDTATAREWALKVKAKPDAEGWWAGSDKFEEWLQTSMAYRLRSAGGNPLRFTDDRWRHCILSTLFERAADPVEVWMASLPAWDGKDRLDTLFIDTLGAEDTPLNRNAARGLLIGAVARTRDPGCLHDWIPVLIGRQGCGKSSFCRSLLPEQSRLDWFSDSINLDDPEQKQVEQAGNSLIVEYAEMRGAMTAKRDALKSHITKTTANYRRPYERNATQVLRSFVGIGTANDTGTGVLPYDPSGYRRYVSIALSCDCDTPIAEACRCDQPRRMREYLDSNRLQLWAEAVARYESAEDKVEAHLIDRRLTMQQREANRGHASGNEVLADLIANLGTQDSGQPIGDLMYRAGWITTLAEGTDRRKQMDFAQGLIAAGWYKYRSMVRGKEATRWYAPEPELIPSTCTLCGGENGGNPLTPAGLCVQCVLDEPDQDPRTVQRPRTVSPALARLAEGGPAVLDAEGVAPDQVDTAQRVLLDWLRRNRDAVVAQLDNATTLEERLDWGDHVNQMGEEYRVEQSLAGRTPGQDAVDEKENEI